MIFPFSFICLFICIKKEILFLKFFLQQDFSVLSFATHKDYDSSSCSNGNMHDRHKVTHVRVANQWHLTLLTVTCQLPGSTSLFLLIDLFGKSFRKTVCGGKKISKSWKILNGSLSHSHSQLSRKKRQHWSLLHIKAFYNQSLLNQHKQHQWRSHQNARACGSTAAYIMSREWDHTAAVREEKMYLQNSCRQIEKRRNCWKNDGNRSRFAVELESLFFYI